MPALNEERSSLTTGGNVDCSNSRSSEQTKTEHIREPNHSASMSSGPSISPVPSSSTSASSITKPTSTDYNHRDTIDTIDTIDTSTMTSTSSTEPALVYSEKTIYPGVYAVVLARPQEHNALSKRLLSELEEVLDNLATSTSEPLRAIIIRSSVPGKFCAGADLKERRVMSEDEVVQFLGGLRRIFGKIAHFPCPTIAALDGPTLGGGLEMAIACDFRVANRTIRKIGFPEAGLGIIPGAGGTQRAPRLLGLTKAKELIYTGRSLTAQEAFEWGLVDYLSNEENGGNDDQNQAYVRALELASLMCQSAPLALRAAKLSISKGLDMELDDALQWEIKCYEKLLPTSDRREALEAFKDKRKPVFKGI